MTDEMTLLFGSSEVSDSTSASPAKSSSSGAPAPYVALARKWRPAQFPEIVGQSHVVRTLSNAIRSQRLHHAYLFTGSRGIGKTSIARIFSKVIRCADFKLQEGWLLSCDRCSSCKEITNGNSVDVLEIDGASNNGVDAIREIRENAKFLPSVGSKKIYIIDEVHMLTTAAFNALLKTLEEPPSHVIFIFATTEPHKLPATILSRCQRYDFRRVNADQIEGRVDQILESENLQAEPGSLAILAQAADGSMRDALSLLDQAIAFCGAKLTNAGLRECFGMIEAQVIHRLLKAVLARDTKEALQVVASAHRQGHDLKMIARNLLELLHRVVLTQIGALEEAGLELTAQEVDELHALSKLRPLEELDLIFQAIHVGFDHIARSPQPKATIDLLIIKCALAEALVEVGAGPTPAGSGSVTGSGTVTGAKAGASTHTSKANSVEMHTSVHASAHSGVRSEAPPENQSEGLDPSQHHRSTSAAVSLPNDPTTDENAVARNALQSVRAALASGSSSSNGIPSGSSANVARPPVSPVTVAAPKNSAPLAAPTQWIQIVDAAKASRPMLGMLLEHAISAELPTQPTGADCKIYFKPDQAFRSEQVKSKACMDPLSSLLRELFGRNVVATVEIKDLPGQTLAEKRETQRQTIENAALSEARNHPILREAHALLGGELGPIELTGGGIHAAVQ
jgi:DNA polymerase III subunit gamma/tau